MVNSLLNNEFYFAKNLSFIKFGIAWDDSDSFVAVNEAENFTKLN